MGLTDAEIAAFGVSNSECYSDSISTAGLTVCPCVEVAEDGDNLRIVTNSVPSHGQHLKGYEYRDIFRGFCLAFYAQDGSYASSSSSSGSSGPPSGNGPPTSGPPTGRRLQTLNGCTGTEYTVPKNPTKNANPTCVGQTMGIALDGVELWNQYAPENIASTGLPLSSAADGVDAGKGMFAEPMDPCSGHPGPNGVAYHYHKLPAFGTGDEAWSYCTPGIQ